MLAGPDYRDRRLSGRIGDCAPSHWSEGQGGLGGRSQLPCDPPCTRSFGARTVAVPVDDQGLVVSRGRKLAPRAAFAVVTPGQQAPSAVTLSPQRRTALLHWATESNAWIIEDDYLAELHLSGRSANALASGAGADRVIHLGTFSKTISPMVGIGFLVAPMPLARQLLEIAT